LPMRAIRSRLLLVAWEIWKERNARIFQHAHAMVEALLAKIKGEAAIWCLAGAQQS
ncbi:hypothetical protein BAE44_0022071, partial [Dichanthelium oligosanthes]